MRKLNRLLPLFFLFVACNSKKSSELTASSSFDEETEKAAIIKTIESEIESFYKRNYEGWKKNFVQSGYAFQGWNNSDGTFDAKVGWRAVDAKIGNYIKANPIEPGTSSHPKVERRNMIVKFYNDSVAYLVWDQYNSDKEMKNYYQSKEERIMEKHDSVWKIANVSAFWDYKNLIPADSLNQ